MQKLLIVIIVLIAGFSLSMTYSVALFGGRRTKESLAVLTGRTVSLFLPSKVFSDDSSLRKLIDIGKGDQNTQFFLDSGNSINVENMDFPMIVPTDGIAGHKNFLFLPSIHPGIDIWSNLDGSGVDGKKYGYPVYAACSGVVTHYKQSNEEIEITCDRLPERYTGKVPSLHVKVLYSHLGDGETLEPFHNLKLGNKIAMGEFVGYQGNKSSFVPENRVVHLHFGVYDLSSGKTPAPALDPMYYMGVSTHKVGQVFKSPIEQNVAGEAISNE